MRPAARAPVGVKICGVTSPAAVEAACRCGARALGFVFAASPRRIALERASELLRLVPLGVRRIAVFADEVPGPLLDGLARLPIDAVQADAGACAAVAARGLATIPVFRDADGVEESLASFLAGHPVPLVVFEGPVSGAGRVPDWSRAARLARRVPLVLAGGLHPGNVADAIATVAPAMVDVSSGVESAPGVKDPERIAAFCRAAFGHLGASP